MMELIEYRSFINSGKTTGAHTRNSILQKCFERIIGYTP